MGMKTKQRKHEPQVGVAKLTHARLNKLKTERGMTLGALTTRILDAYLKRLAEGTDWLEKPKGER